MNRETFNIVSNELASFAPNVPMWGRRQNFEDNSVISLGQLKRIFTLSHLERVLTEKGLDEDSKNYHRRRWFHTWCAWCDEYLFYSLRNVRKNPDEYSADWDIEFDNGEQYDIKSTKVLARIEKNKDFGWILTNHDEIIESLEQNASNSRKTNQDRLYVLTYSKKSHEQSQHDLLAVDWELKRKAFKYVADNIDTIDVFYHNGVNVILLYLIENADGSTKFFTYEL